MNPDQIRLLLQLAQLQHHLDDAEVYSGTGHQDAAHLSLDDAEEGVEAIGEQNLPPEGQAQLEEIEEAGDEEEEEAGVEEAGHEDEKIACFQLGQDVLCRQLGLVGERRELFKKIARQVALGRVVTAQDMRESLGSLGGTPNPKVVKAAGQAPAKPLTDAEMAARQQQRTAEREAQNKAMWEAHAKKRAPMQQQIEQDQKRELLANKAREEGMAWDAQKSNHQAKTELAARSTSRHPALPQQDQAQLDMDPFSIAGRDISRTGRQVLQMPGDAWRFGSGLASGAANWAGRQVAGAGRGLVSGMIGAAQATGVPQAVGAVGQAVQGASQAQTTGLGRLWSRYGQGGSAYRAVPQTQQQPKAHGVPGFTPGSWQARHEQPKPTQQGRGPGTNAILSLTRPGSPKIPGDPRT